jgi:hypothetical protein
MYRVSGQLSFVSWVLDNLSGSFTFISVLRPLVNYWDKYCPANEIMLKRFFSLLHTMFIFNLPNGFWKEL